MNKKNSKKKENKFLKKQILIIFLLIIMSISIISILGRYVTNTAKDFFSRSKEFYFYSDKLDEKTAVFQIDNWTGVSPYTFTIDMNSRKNNIEGASYDIGYTINYTCTPNAICQLSKTEGIIPKETNSDLFYLTITPNTQLDTGDKVVVEVEATTNEIYKKTIKGKYTLVVGKEKLSYAIDDKPGSPYLILNITNTISYYTVKEAFGTYQIGQKIDIDTYKALPQTDKNKCYSRIVDIDFDPTKTLLDMTNENYAKTTNRIMTTINGKNYIRKFKIEMEPISSMKFRFYKADKMKDYTYPNNQNKSIIKVTSK